MKQMDKTVEIEITKAELEEKFFKGTCCHALGVLLYANLHSALDRHRHTRFR